MFERFDHIYKHASADLARLQEPNFDVFDEDDLLEAFGFKILLDNVWSRYFQELISQMGNQQTQLVETSFYTGIRGINKQFILIQGDTHQKVVIATGLPPIMFWQDEN